MGTELMVALAAAVVLVIYVAFQIWMRRRRTTKQQSPPQEKKQEKETQYEGGEGWFKKSGGVAIPLIVVAIFGLLFIVFLPLAAFVLGFVLVALLLSPIYALRSADAYEETVKEPRDGGERVRKLRTEWFLIFVRRRPNRLMQRIKGTNNAGIPIDFIGFVPPGRTLHGETTGGRAENLTKAHPKYWQMIDDESVQRAPTGVRIHRYWFVRLWMRYINLFSDVALVGVRKLYSIYTYPIEKTRYKKQSIDEASKEEVTAYKVIPPDLEERSDHVRIAPFQWHVAIEGALTHDRVSWNLIAVGNFKSMNPWQTLHNQENWSQFLTNAMTDSLVRGLRNLDLEDVVNLMPREVASSLMSPEERRKFDTPAGHLAGLEARDKVTQTVYQIGERLKSVIGLEFDKTASETSPDYSGGVQLLHIMPSLENDDDKLAFTQVWRSRQEANSELILKEAEALGEAAVIASVADEVQKRGEAGIVVQKSQALENSAKTGKSTVVFDNAAGGGQSSSSKVEQLLAILVEDRLRDREQTRQEGGE